MVAARVSVWQLHSSLGQAGQGHPQPLAYISLGQTPLRSGSPAACCSPCWPVLAFASRSRTGFDAVERPSYEGCSVLRCLVKVSRLPGPRSDANGRAGSPLAGHQKTGSHMAGRPRTGSRVAAADRVTHGRPAEGRVAHGRPLWVRVTGGRRGQGHTWPATRGQGRPWPAALGQGRPWPAALGQGHRWPPRTGSHMAGRPRTGSPMATLDRVTAGRPARGRPTTQAASARVSPLQAHLDHHPPVPPTAPWLHRPPPGTHGTSPSKFQRPSPGGALGGGSAMTGAEGNSESHTKSVA